MADAKINDGSIAEQTSAGLDDLFPIGAVADGGDLTKIKFRKLIMCLDPAIGLIIADPLGGYLQITVDSTDMTSPLVFTHIAVLP